MMEGDRAAKMKQNVKTLKEMERLFREGGKVRLGLNHYCIINLIK